MQYLPVSASSGNPVLSFELKPKWGSLPRHPMDPIETEMCRYCIQQCQKLRSGKVHEHSCFCPIELFGSPLKRLHALVSLLQTPQNNLSLRVNGERVLAVVEFKP
ncbi:hypothetical protein WA538_005628 [Blastocystis sp. DL]